MKLEQQTICKLLGLYLVCLLMSVGHVAAQTIQVSGIVTDTSNAPIIGATVKVAEVPSNGAVTNAEGRFVLKNVASNATLQVSYVGMKAATIPVNGKTEIKIVLQEDSEMLEEVVVTALGIKRDRKALGYAIQEVKGDELVEAREANVANALVGKVSGLQVMKSSNGPAGSSKIVIRGNNSVTGLNQPLIVVDGVPIDNFTGASNNDIWNPSPDMGNGLSDINPEDIESMSVLKGASAAALYGSRAGNGVILITTKSGRKSAGLGITVSSSIALETLFMRPDRQNVFGQGTKGIYDGKSGTSWGPKIEGQEYKRWDGQSAKMQYFDNVRSYFDKPGQSYTNNISFQQEFKNLALYTSLNRLDDISKIPGAGLKRTSFTTRATSNFGPDERFTLDTKIQYISTTAQNRPLNGNNASNPFLRMYTLPISLDITEFSDAKDENGKMIWWGTESSEINPYWSKDNIKNVDTRERFIFYGSLKYRFTDWLDAEVRGGMDRYFTEIENKTYGGSPLTPTGRYFYGQDKFLESNYSFLLSAHKDKIRGEWGAAATFGGNMMYRRSAGVSGNPDELLVKDLFTFGNIKNKIEADHPFSQKKINSLYGTAQINYGGFFFLDATLRTDWSSTLAPDNRAFTYPSLSTSFVISELVNRNGQMPHWFNYAKVRASFAQVGNDLAPYELYNTYSIGVDAHNNTIASTNSTLYDSNVRSELITSYEVGAEMRFFDNRLSMDVAWYRTNATRQLLNLPYDGMSGYTGKKINAGNIQNQGVEIMITGYPVQLDDFAWMIQGNFSLNRNTIVELSPEVKDFYQLGGFDNLSIVAKVGGNYGEIYGTSFKRVEDANSPYNGMIMVDKSGLPIGNEEKVKVGDQQPDFNLGITNSFRYKRWNLAFQIDGRFGGHMFSGTNHILQANGVSSVTAPGGQRNKFVVEGVVADDRGTLSPNTVEVTPQDYWERVVGATGNLGIVEHNIYSATNVRLRNIQLAYDFDKSLIEKLYLQRLKLGFSINNVWMITSRMRGVDPESVFATGTNATGFEAYSAPTSRTYLFNITLGF